MGLNFLFAVDCRNYDGHSPPPGAAVGCPLSSSAVAAVGTYRVMRGPASAAAADTCPVLSLNCGYLLLAAFLLLFHSHFVCS